MAASYPGALKTYTEKTNKVDLYDAVHMNSVQEEVVAIQTELGTDPAGSCTDVKTRLFVSIGNDGAVRQGTGFPANPIQGQLFWRSDESTMYIRAASTWQALGMNLSNVLFCWNGVDGGTTNDAVWYQGASLTPNIDATAAAYNFFGVRYTGDSYRAIPLFGMFTKVAGISTITIHARLWNENNGSTTTLQCVIGGSLSGAVSTTQATPGWVTVATIDVSSLTNGTAYSIAFNLKTDNASYGAYCSAVMLIAS